MFSEAVDRVVERSRRNDRQQDIVDWMLMTMRECQEQALFYNDRVEDKLSPTASPFIWTLPTNLRLLETVIYSSVDGSCPDVFPPNIDPGKRQKNQYQYYYGASGYVVFNGCGLATSNASIPVSYFVWRDDLTYYDIGERPAVWDPKTKTWSYNPVTIDPVQQEADRDLVTNWMLLNYRMTIIEGTLAKLWKDVGETARATTSYSLYMQRRPAMMAAGFKLAFPNATPDNDRATR